MPAPDDADVGNVDEVECECALECELNGETCTGCGDVGVRLSMTSGFHFLLLGADEDSAEAPVELVVTDDAAMEEYDVRMLLDVSREHARHEGQG